MNYAEEKSVCAAYKQEYVQGIVHLLEKRQKRAEKIRERFFRNFFLDPEKYREELKRMLGWPLTEKAERPSPAVSATELSEEDGYTIYRMQVEIMEGLTMTGLYFKVHSDKPQPLVIVQHGGQGTPEMIAGFYNGTTYNYNGMLQRVMQYGVHAFAPQLLLWNQEGFSVKYNRNELDARLKRVGSSITAIEVYGIMRVIDHFEKEKGISSFGMVGLSYGGFYTLVTSAVDTRIRSAISCSFFNKRDVAGWCDWTWFRSAEKFDDAEIACLIYPRHICLQMGDKDKLFDSRYTRESFDTIRKLFGPIGTDWIDLMIFDGNHEFCKDDKPIADMIRDLRA